MKKWLISLLLLLVVLSIVVLAVQFYSSGQSEPSVWQLPPHFPPIKVPPDNPLTADKIKLGRYLFYDKRLSVNGTTSCATCHQQSLAFTDGRARAVGATGEVHPRSAMSLANLVYLPRLTWANPLLDRLEHQALIPMFSETPVEMGLAGKEEWLINLLRRDERYQTLFPEAFPDSQNPFTLENVTRAIASFQRSLISANSSYDRFLQGEQTALSDSAKRGMALFFSEQLECFHCHGGFNFTDSIIHQNLPTGEIAFHNTGLYNLDEQGAYPSPNTGIHEVTGKAADMGRFRAPTLRNIAVTAPYMHDGSIPTLYGVLEHYALGGRTVHRGPLSGDGSKNPLKSGFVNGFFLTRQQVEDVIAFLHSLTDEHFLTNPNFSDPFISSKK